MSKSYVDLTYVHAVRCLLWSEIISIPEDGDVPDWYRDMDGSPFDEYYAFDDVIDQNDELYSDVMHFVNQAWGLIHDMEPEQVGHDFILSRNHHGTGFWDRGLEMVGDALHDMAADYGTAHMDVSSEGKATIYA